MEAEKVVAWLHTYAARCVWGNGRAENLPPSSSFSSLPFLFFLKIVQDREGSR